MNIVAIIQARMGSTRLPGKVLMDIEGKPMLWHIVNRLKCSKYINKIVVATSSNKRDEAIEEFCKKYKIDFYRGNEEDVLDRYYQTAKLFKADPIIRITADCPLIDPEIVDLVVKEYFRGDFDYVSNTMERTFPLGLDTEIFSFSALGKAHMEAKKDYEREHVTVCFYEKSHLFKLNNVENNQDSSHLRWTVDEEKDLLFIKEVYKRSFKKEKIFLMKDIINLLEKEPYLIEINKEVKQKSIK